MTRSAAARPARQRAGSGSRGYGAVDLRRAGRPSGPRRDRAEAASGGSRPGRRRRRTGAAGRRHRGHRGQTSRPTSSTGRSPSRSSSTSGPSGASRASSCRPCWRSSPTGRRQLAAGQGRHRREPAPAAGVPGAVHPQSCSWSGRASSSPASPARLPEAELRGFLAAGRRAGRQSSRRRAMSPDGSGGGSAPQARTRRSTRWRRRRSTPWTPATLTAPRPRSRPLVAAQPGNAEAQAGAAPGPAAAAHAWVRPGRRRRAAADASPDDVDAQTLAADFECRRGAGRRRPSSACVDLVRRTGGDERDRPAAHLLDLFAAPRRRRPAGHQGPDRAGERPVLTVRPSWLAPRGATTVRSSRSQMRAERRQDDPCRRRAAAQPDPPRRAPTPRLPTPLPAYSSESVLSTSSHCAGERQRQPVAVVRHGGEVRDAGEHGPAGRVVAPAQEREHVAGRVVGVDPLEAGRARGRAATAPASAGRRG